MDITARAFTESWENFLPRKSSRLTNRGQERLQVAKPWQGQEGCYTIGYITNAAMVYARILNPETIHFDPDKDIEPLGLHVQLPLAIGVQATPHGRRLTNS